MNNAKRRKASFFLDVLVATLLAVIALTAIVFSFKTNAAAFASVSQNAVFEKKAIYFADSLLKKCLPEGIAQCEKKFVHVKEIDLRSAQEIVLKKGFGFEIRDLNGRMLQTRGMPNESANAFCVSRPAFLESEVVVLKACVFPNGGGEK
ncbi:hypothetical protein H0N96_01130 [Candidatus Micrarchaeota archaeon]|nr:hypothetical protein [Candidatus Micrarchaeota archaeon]